MSHSRNEDEAHDAYGPGDLRWSRAAVGRAAVRGVLWTGLQYWGYNMLALAAFVVLGRLLSPADFGLAAAANTVILFLRVIVDAGFSQLLVQKKQITAGEIDTAFWTAVAMGTLCALVIASGAPLIAVLFGMPKLTTIVRVLAVVFILVGLDSTQSALLTREMKFSSQAIRRLIAALVSCAVAITMAVMGLGVWSLVAQQIVLEGTTVLILWRLSPWRPGFHFLRSAWREFLSFGGRYSLMRILWYLGQNADNFLVAIFLGPVALGYYVIAYRILVVLNELFNTTISQVSLSTFSKLRDDQGGINNALYDATALLAAVGVPVYAGLAVLARPLLIVVFGAKWTPSVPVLEALTLAGGVQSLGACMSSYVIAIGLVRYEMWSVMGVVVAEIAGFAVAVHHGITAVAWALGIVLVIAWPIRLLLLRRWGGVSPAAYARRLPAIAGSAAVMVGATLGIAAAVGGAPIGVRLTIEILVAAMVYPAALRLLSPSLVRRLVVIGRGSR